MKTKENNKSANVSFAGMIKGVMNNANFISIINLLEVIKTWFLLPLSNNIYLLIFFKPLLSILAIIALPVPKHKILKYSRPINEL